MADGLPKPGARRLARELGPGQMIVTILCDSGARYASKLYSAEFMRSKGLPAPEWMERKATAPDVAV